MDPLSHPRTHTLARPVVRPAYRPIVCLDHGLTHGAEVTAVTAPATTAAVDETVLSLAVAAADQASQAAALTVDLTGTARLRDLPATVSALIRRHQVDPASLGIKLDAARAVADLPETTEAFDGLRRLGCPVGIAGVGASLGSLRLLGSLPMDFAELSAELVDRMLEGADALAETAAVLRRVADAGLVSVGAGVATHEQAQWLRDLGCQRGHGLYFGEPSHWLAPSTAHGCPAG